MTRACSQSSLVCLSLTVISGLCGGVHSSLSKLVRRTLDDPASDVDPESPVVVIGDKAKAQLSRTVPNNLVLTINQVGKDVPTFADAAGVTDLILDSGAKFDSIVVVYNRFISAISYESVMKEIQPGSVLEKSDGFRKYDQEEDNTGYLSQFTLANAVYAALVEGHAAEQSARSAFFLFTVIFMTYALIMPILPHTDVMQWTMPPKTLQT